jgi:hypothetical protein
VGAAVSGAWWVLLLAGAAAGGSIDEDTSSAGCWDARGDLSMKTTAAGRVDGSVRRTGTSDRSGGRTRGRKRS